MTIYATLYSEAPLSFRESRDPTHTATLPYVPGSAVLGGLAAAARTDGLTNQQFADWFLRGRVRFGNLYPASFTKDALQGLAPVYPVPLTARSCKRFGGFRFQDEPGDPHHGVTDALIPLTLFALSGESQPTTLDGVRKCPVCGQPLDRMDGFYRVADNPTHIGQPHVGRAIRTRTGINYDTGTVAQGILYSRQTLPANSNFWGEWHAEGDVTAFKQFVERASEAGQVRLGSNRTRGLGRVVIRCDDQPDEDWTMVRERVMEFDQLLQTAARKAHINLSAKLYVPLTLLSDVVLYDRLLRPQLTLSSEYLAQVWGLSGAQVIVQVSGVRRIESWSALWGLPKADDLAIAMRSVFVVALASDDRTTLQALHRLQTQGCGARRAEGFGVVRVADRFHIDHTLGQGGYR